MLKKSDISLNGDHDVYDGVKPSTWAKLRFVIIENETIKLSN